MNARTFPQPTGIATYDQRDRIIDVRDGGVYQDVRNDCVRSGA